MAREVGIFGGSFDPIHIGHLVIASEVCEQLSLDEVRFVVAPRPPHKQSVVGSDEDRAAMVRLAIAPDDRFRLDLREFQRTGASYTHETLSEMQAEEPDTHLTFIMGEDSLKDLPGWRFPNEILSLAQIAVASRPKVELDFPKLFAALPAARGRIRQVFTPEIALSSTLIRNRLLHGQSIRYLVPSDVESYIGSRALYSS